MSVTDELNELIALHGNCRDALNVTLAKLRQAESEIAVLKEAAQQPLAGDLAGLRRKPPDVDWDALDWLQSGNRLR
jgi:hypothetical protein